MNKAAEIMIILIIFIAVLQHNLVGSGLTVVQNIIIIPKEKVDKLEWRVTFLTSLIVILFSP